MDRTPTVYDVAERAGVSIATVSRVLRKPEVVREATRRQVMDAVLHLGYVPSGNARGLADRRTGVLGLLLPSHDQPRSDRGRPLPADGRIEFVLDEHTEDRAPHNLYYDEVLLGAESESWSDGFALMVAAGGARRALELPDIAGRVDGLVAVANAVPVEVLAHAARRIPVALIAEQHDPTLFDHVSASNREGMRALVEHLIEVHGVRSMTFVAGPEGSPDSAERQLGAQDAAASGRAALHVEAGDFTRRSGRRAAEQLLERDGLPDAIVCANDQTALGALDVLSRRGLRTPADTIVTGFDGIDAASAADLTTVQQPMFGLGVAAIRLVMERLSGARTETTAVKLAVDVVLRGSCGCTAPTERR